MYAFYFTRSATLKLAEKQRAFVAPLDIKHVPLEEIWVDTKSNMQMLCDYVQTLGKVEGANPIFVQSKQQLPLCLNGTIERSFLFNDKSEQIQELKKRLKAKKKFRLLLFNAFGTSLGDNFVGAQIFEWVLLRLRSLQVNLEIEVVRTWKSTKPDYILKELSWIKSIQSTPLNFCDFLEYDAFYDFSDFNYLPGFLTKPWPDFQLINFGIDPSEVPAILKRAHYTVRRQIDFEHGVDLVNGFSSHLEHKRVFLHAQASNYLRSIPDSVLKILLIALKQRAYEFMTVDSSVYKVAKELDIDCTQYKHKNLDELCGIVSCADLVISTETFLLHVACAVSSSVIGLFVCTQAYDNTLMLPYQPNLMSINVDTKKCFAKKFAMTQEQVSKSGDQEYFMSSWENAIERAISSLKS